MDTGFPVFVFKGVGYFPFANSTLNYRHPGFGRRLQRLACVTIALM
jgi:hypothetical protein